MMGQVSWVTKSFSRPLIWWEPGPLTTSWGGHLTLHAFINYKSLEDIPLHLHVFRWAFKMYDEDNSREIDINEMERVMQVMWLLTTD